MAPIKKQPKIEQPQEPEKPVTEVAFGTAFEVFIDARRARDDAETRMKAQQPILERYVKANGEHTKSETASTPGCSNDTKLDYNGFRAHYQYFKKPNENEGIKWVQHELAKPDIDPALKAEFEKLLVPTFVLNWDLWEVVAERPNSPITSEIASKVVAPGFKLVIKDLAKKECECGAEVKKGFKFCPNCGKVLDFSNAHKAKGSDDPTSVVDKRKLDV